MDQSQPLVAEAGGGISSLIAYCADFLESAGNRSLGTLHFRYGAARRGYLDVALLTCDEELLFEKSGSIVIGANRRMEASMSDVGIAFDGPSGGGDGPADEAFDLARSVEIGAFELMHRMYGMVRGNPYEFECTYGAFFLEGVTRAGDPVFLPLLTTPVAINYNEKDNTFLIRRDQDYATLNVHAISRLIPLQYKRIKDQLLKHSHLPIPVDVDRLLEVLQILHDEGKFIRLPRELIVAPSMARMIEYQTTRSAGLEPGHYRINRAAGIAVLRRASFFSYDDLQAMREYDPRQFENTLLSRLTQRRSTPPLHVNAESESLMGHGEVFFPFPTNQQQIAIAYAIEKHDLVLVQGPPGTGKSQTLANLAVHLAARGRRVLLVSEQPKAVEVATKKYLSTLGIDFLPMTVTRKDGEIQSGLREKLAQVGRLAAATSAEDGRRAADVAESAAEKCRLRLIELHHELHRAVEFEAMPWAETGLTPGQLASEYVASERRHEIDISSEAVRWSEQDQLVELLIKARRLSKEAKLTAVDVSIGVNGPGASDEIERIISLVEEEASLREQSGSSDVRQLPYFSEVAESSNRVGRCLEDVVNVQTIRMRDYSRQESLAAFSAIRGREVDSCRRDLEAVETARKITRDLRTALTN